MKVRYTEFCLNPALRGTTTHLPQHRAIALIDQGAAVEVPMATRGTPEWLKDMQERSASLNPTSPNTPLVTWAINLATIANRYAVVARCSAPNCAVLRYDGPPSGAKSLVFTHSCSGAVPDAIPASVVEQYRKLHRPVSNYNADEALAAQLAAPRPSRPVDLSKVLNQPPNAPSNACSVTEKTGLANFSATPTSFDPFAGASWKK
jgi:hypothetical protein